MAYPAAKFFSNTPDVRDIEIIHKVGGFLSPHAKRAGFQSALSFTHAIHNPIGSVNDFANRLVLEFRHHASKEGKFIHLLRLLNEFVTEPFGSLRVVAGNE
jgi:hypothetical protein